MKTTPNFRYCTHSSDVCEILNSRMKGIELTADDLLLLFGWSFPWSSDKLEESCFLLWDLPGFQNKSDDPYDQSMILFHYMHSYIQYFQVLLIFFLEFCFYKVCKKENFVLEKIRRFSCLSVKLFRSPSKIKSD